MLCWIQSWGRSICISWMIFIIKTNHDTYYHSTTAVKTHLRTLGYIISMIHNLLYIQGIWYLPRLTLFSLSGLCQLLESNSQHSIIRWWSAHNHRFINIKRSVCCCEIIAKRQANPLWQTGRRFMYTLAHSYGVTRRGMTQCISASLLVLDRWSRPNMTVPSLILSKACANFMYRLYWQWWLIGNVKNVSVPPPTRYAWCCSAEVHNDLWLLDQMQTIYDSRMSFAFSRFTHITFVFHLFSFKGGSLSCNYIQYSDDLDHVSRSSSKVILISFGVCRCRQKCTGIIAPISWCI